MARPLRDKAAGIFHVFSHSVRDELLFVDDLDRFDFADEVAQTAARYAWTVIEVCLMQTHYHLLLETPDDSLPVGMQRLKFRYACRFNSRHRLRGHVFEARYKSKRITTDAYLVGVFRYIARNPVEAGLVKRAEDWAWGSYRALALKLESFTFVDASRVVGWFGGGDAGLRRLRQYVDGDDLVMPP
jgi:putative transposase